MNTYVQTSVNDALLAVSSRLKQAAAELELAMQVYDQEEQQFGFTLEKRRNQLVQIFKTLEEIWLHSGSSWRRPKAAQRPESLGEDKIRTTIALSESIRQAILDPDSGIKMRLDGHTPTRTIIEVKYPPRPRFPYKSDEAKTMLARLLEQLEIARTAGRQWMIISLDLAQQLGVEYTEIAFFS